MIPPLSPCASDRPPAVASSHLARGAWRPAVWLATLATVACFVPVQAVRTNVITHETFQDFSAGDLKNVSLHRDGRLRLAPGAEEVARLADAVIWSAVAGPDGSFYIAAGSEGKVYQLSGDGQLEELFDTSEVLSRAMAVAADGRLYVGTSPNGKVYRYAGEGEAELLFDPEEAYIWALLFNEAGDLFVGTGDKGKIFRLPAGFQPDDEAEVYFDSDESHISALAWDEQQRLLVGTSPRGYLYRVEGPDEVFVLFNSPDEEIRQVVPRKGGELYIATFAGQAASAPASGGTTPATGAVAQALAALARESEDESEEKASPASPRATSTAQGRRAAPSGPRPSTLYRVDADGFHEPFWGLPDATIHSLLPLDDGSLLIGTGSEGRLFTFSGFQQWKLRQTLRAGSDLSVILQGARNGEVFVFTSNPGRIYRLNFEVEGEGEFVSDVFDAEQMARWGRLHVQSGNGGRSGVRRSVRSGNTERPDATWTSWRDLGEEGTGAVPSRYFQYRLTLSDPDAEVRRIRFFYRHANAAPVISALRVVTADVGLERYLLPPQPPTLDLEQLLRNPRSNPGTRQEPRQQLRAYERPGTITVAWQARDPNDDELTFTLRMRAADADEWDIIADDIWEEFYSFTGHGLADGDYQVEVVASDRRANPSAEARTASRESEVFAIDNTAPEIMVEQVDNDGGAVRIAFRAVDQSSIIAGADFIVDGGEPVRLFPEDGLFDSREERFVAETADVAPGRRTIILRIADEAANPRIHTLNIEVQPGR